MGVTAAASAILVLAGVSVVAAATSDHVQPQRGTLGAVAASSPLYLPIFFI